MCVGDTSVKDWVPTTWREANDPHHFRTNDKAERRHEALGVHQKEMPTPPPPPPRPQGAKAPSSTPLKRRNFGAGGPAGSETMLTGSGGIGQGQMNLGASSLLGG